MKKHILKLAGLATMLLLFMTSCQKETLTTDDTQISASQSSSDAASLVEEADDEAAYRMSPTTSVTGCPTVTWSDSLGTFPNTCTIDFGTSCTGQNGHILSGKITVDVSAPYYTQGSVRVTHTDNLTIDSNSVVFNRTVTNMGMDVNNHMYWTVVVSGTRIRASDGTSGTWTANRVRTMTAGLETQDNPQDDVVEITGGATGVCHMGHSFTSTITTPLVKRGDCQWIVSGVEVATVDGRRGQRTMDFGDGTCDDKGTVTLPNGTTREVTLHRRIR